MEAATRRQAVRVLKFRGESAAQSAAIQSHDHRVHGKELHNCSCSTLIHCYYFTTYIVRVSFSFGLSLNRPTLPSSDPALDTLAKLQLSAVGVRLPESSTDSPCALWKSPKSPKPSKLESSSDNADGESVDDESDQGSEFGAAAASENGPNAS